MKKLILITLILNTLNANAKDTLLGVNLNTYDSIPGMGEIVRSNQPVAPLGIQNTIGTIQPNSTGGMSGTLYNLDTGINTNVYIDQYGNVNTFNY